jgi:hypothetical protein
MNNLAHGILLIYVMHILHNSINVVSAAAVVAVVVIVNVAVIIIIIIRTKITNQCYNVYSRLGVVSHWLFRYAQELATCTGKWEKLLEVCEIKTIFYGKCGHHTNDPQKCGKLCIRILKNLVLHAWGNTMKEVSFGRFIVHGADPQKCGVFMCFFLQNLAVAMQ